MMNLKRNTLLTTTTLALVSLVLSSCVPSAGTSLRSRDSSSLTGSNSSVGIYQGKILADNPIIRSKNEELSDSFDLNQLTTVVTITSNSFLKGNASCYGLEFCFEVRENQDAPSALQTTTGKWGYSVLTPEFLQVNTFYHLNKVTDMFYNNLGKSFSLAYSGLIPSYKTSLPKSFNPFSGMYNTETNPLIAYANCDVPNNAYFDRANQTLCFGYVAGHDGVKWAQDSTIVYHESGHFFQKLQLNIRNPLAGPRVDVGNNYYDEAGSLGEGLSDYYSYFVNGRPHFGEWAAGRFLYSSRPMTEDDPLHISGVSSDPDQRLSYPQYINYNPNFPTLPQEDVHTAGMIVSHYLVALTNDLQEKCLMTQTDASSYVIHLLTETLAEYGDLNSNGIQSVTTNNRINLSPAHSLEWFRTVNPINYRTFMQTFAKNLLLNLGSPTLNRCNGGIYSKDQIESLIDQYGLLLFRSYNENRSLAVPNTATANTVVTATNRKKSVLISKSLIILDPTTSASSAYVIDDRAKILTGLTSLQSSGLMTSPISSQTPSDLGFNNNNGKISPGEVVAIALNLYNNSNSPMGGVQVLANDWNHADASGKPCRFPTTMSNDSWPLDSEGGVPCSTTSASAATDFAPVCFIQSNEANSTKWVSQKDFATKMALDSSLCLNPSDPKDCFIRALKGADQSNYSKIDSKSTWGKTLANPTTGKAPNLDFGNVLLFEVSKQIPPGTVVDCRLRVRFTNCEECYHDSDAARANYDYKDSDFNGPRPFKIIHLQIPIID